MYTIRNKNDEMIAKVDNKLAKEIIHGDWGFFRKAIYINDKREVVIFEITTDVKLTYFGTTLFIWKGYKFVPDNS